MRILAAALAVILASPAIAADKGGTDCAGILDHCARVVVLVAILQQRHAAARCRPAQRGKVFAGRSFALGMFRPDDGVKRMVRVHAEIRARF